MISKQFSGKLSERYYKMIKEEIEELQNGVSRNISTEDEIRELVIQYETSKILLAQQETEKTKLSLDYDNHFIILKQEYIQDSVKPTEAKELANNKLANEKLELALFDEDIALLKANIHSIEYQLRLKYIQLRREYNLSYDDLKPLQ